MKMQFLTSTNDLFVLDVVVPDGAEPISWCHEQGVVIGTNAKGQQQSVNLAHVISCSPQEASVAQQLIDDAQDTTLRDETRRVPLG